MKGTTYLDPENAVDVGRELNAGLGHEEMREVRVDGSCSRRTGEAGAVRRVARPVVGL